AQALFDQNGKPLDRDLPFIEDEREGSRFGYAKPYILGYALEGLPELLRFAPKEPRLEETVRAVADFLAQTQDPLGGWRYPHPRSSELVLSQAMEHAWQLTHADQVLGPSPRHLDAIERVLRQRFWTWKKTRKMLSLLTGWEYAEGGANERIELSRLYAKPE